MKSARIFTMQKKKTCDFSLKNWRWRSSFFGERKNAESLTRDHTSSLLLAPSPFLLSAPKMQSALLARSGAPSFAAQRCTVRPRAVAARAQIKAPQVNTRSAREASFGASSLRACFYSSVSNLLACRLRLSCAALLPHRTRIALARHYLNSHAEGVTGNGPESTKLEPAISSLSSAPKTTSLFHTHAFIPQTPSTQLKTGRHPAPGGAEAGDCQVRFRRQRREDQLEGRDGEFDCFRRGVLLIFAVSLSLSLAPLSLTPHDHQKKNLNLKKPSSDGLLRHPARRARRRQGHLRDRRDPRRQRPRFLLLGERRRILASLKS